jgi:lipid-A-disaccharide synthase
VALLPGSRRNELHRIAPAMAEALPLIRARVPGVQFVIAAAPGLPDGVFAPLIAGPPEGRHYVRPVLVRGRTDDVVSACDLAITASGTATVQCALHERPMVVVYRVSWLDYQMAKRFLTLPDVAMPNVLAGRRIVPELMQHDFTAASVAAAAVELLINRDKQAAMQQALRRVRESLGGPGASARAADAVLQVARGMRA